MLEFKKISEFPKEILYKQLIDAYSFDDAYRNKFWDEWLEYDNFIYSDKNPFRDKHGFITVLDGVPIGHVTWNNNDDYSTRIKKFCIISKYKNKGYGKSQLIEALHRIRDDGASKVLVTTNINLEPAVKTIEGAGFVKIRERTNIDYSFAGKYLDYEIVVR